MIKLDATYSDYVNTSDPKYPAGKAVDASGEESTDGTPLLAKWMNDINGTRQAIIKEAFGDMSSISGVPDDADDSDVLKALKKITQDYTNQKFIEHYQKGYFQMPGMPSPLEDLTMHYAGYSWYEVNYRGNFFRAKGDNANPFSSKKLTKEQIKNGDCVFQDDEQCDAIREINGYLTTFNVNMYSHQGGALFTTSWDEYSVRGSENISSKVGAINFSVARAGLPTAEENRSRNLTFTFWLLVKNE
ncbi:hypothetical protein E4O00_03340 [Treponema sp. OMZ 788]|uniref:hypothetical protein n=1 Tax=Treponema sp. OMZ 788 TaxID=2563664 RepID=UPI0020A28E40|nr:hypothetical protein [Treponema sp. OMZ 788]UTC65211.1 hypothetical protein E4O00_03340 [Treponema sp. OMZ 788]